jgi:uncharacterized repeat protein (TIGR01451 family)
VLFATTSFAASHLEVTSLSQKRVERLVDGQTVITFEDVSAVVPGERVLMRTVVKNTGDEAATAVHIVSSIPDGTTYATEVLNTLFEEVSVDSGKTFQDRSTASIKLSDSRVRPALATDYDAVRWTLEVLPAGSTVEFGVYVLVDEPSK